MTDPIQRRQFLKLTTGTALAGILRPSAAKAADEIGAIYQRVVPAIKNLDAAWALSLAKRGAPRDAGIECTDKNHLPQIGMTVGGIGCGTVYLSGDGRLYVWDVFHQAHEGVVANQTDVPKGLLNIDDANDPKRRVRERDGSNYIVPPSPDRNPNPFKQGFELSIEGETSPRPLDRRGWDKVEFTGRWPLGTIAYSAASCPVAVKLESWTPFIPLATEDSSLPVTVMEYTLENRSDKTVKGVLTGIWENPVLVHTKRRAEVSLASKVIKGNGVTMLFHSASEKIGDSKPQREDIVFETFERESLAPWVAEGIAFGTNTVAARTIPDYQGEVGQVGERLVNSHASAPGEGLGAKDDAKGQITSPSFAISRRYIRLLLGGGNRPQQTGVEVLVDDQVVARANGHDSNKMREVAMDVSRWEGRNAKLRIIDHAGGAWGNIGADHIIFSDSLPKETALKDAADMGTAVLALLDVEAIDSGNADDRLSTAFELAPSSRKTIRFLLTWHFPNMRNLPGTGKHTPLYTKRFTDAAAAALEVAASFHVLRARTMTWVATWNDSSLPQWLLDRSILTTNTLQTTNCHVLDNGRFWAWEGIGCCPGTCAHVWHYAQGIARLFPDLERNLREVTDYGVAMNPDGSIRFRAEAANTIAIDSQTGIILRTWREHLVSSDDAFLKRVWPGVKRALDWLVAFDRDGRGGLDGLLDGKQHNTLDAEWYGKVHCLCSLYLAALRAGQEMSLAAGDSAYVAKCAEIHAMGAKKISSLFNGEFYTQEEDPAHSTAIGVGQGCYIDQVIGQWWATQTGLGRIYNEAQIRAALHSLWRYNFVPEIGSFRSVFTKGRFYAMPGDAGLVMCTWPKGGLRDDFKKHWQYAYFNECMTGFEWQAAAHMLQEGSAIEAADFEKIPSILDNPADPRSLTVRGLAVGRAIHDRYSPALRNPYNEIECSDHYGRANASYSLFLAACGFSYNGPAGVIGFDPKIAPGDFKAPFTAAKGWGTFQQKNDAGKWSASLKIRYGSLSLREIQVPWLKGIVAVRLGEKSIPAQVANGSVKFESPLDLTEDGPELLLSIG